MACSRRRVDSLVSLNIDYVIKHLAKYLKYEFDTLKLLPPKIKNRMLHKFTSSSYFWSSKSNFKKALSALINPMTKRIDLSLASADDAILEILKDCHNLRDVYLTRNVNNRITAQALADFLSPLRHLYLLEIANCSGVCDDVLITISTSCPALAGLDVNGCAKVSDVGLEEIAKLENLQWVTFSSTQVTNKGIEKLAAGPSGSKIRELRVANCKHINGDILQVITQYCHSIEVLVFYNLQPHDNESQTYFPLQEGSLKNLKQLTWTIQW